MVVAVSLWWLYFDVVASVTEGVLSKAQGEERSRLARDSYTYLHFPIVISVIYIALGLKKALEYVSDTADHHLSEALTRAPLVACTAGWRCTCSATSPFVAQHRDLEPASQPHRVRPTSPGAAGLATPGACLFGRGRDAACRPSHLRDLAFRTGPRPSSARLSRLTGLPGLRTDRRVRNGPHCLNDALRNSSDSCGASWWARRPRGPRS